MRSDLAGMMAAAVSDNLFEPVEIHPAGEGLWRTVQGRWKRATVLQELPEFMSRAYVPNDELHLLAADFADGYPAAEWWVRFADGTVMKLSTPAKLRDIAGEFLMAVVKPTKLDPPPPNP